MGDYTIGWSSCIIAVYDDIKYYQEIRNMKDLYVAHPTRRVICWFYLVKIWVDSLNGRQSNPYFKIEISSINTYIPSGPYRTSSTAW